MAVALVNFLDNFLNKETEISLKKTMERHTGRYFFHQIAILRFCDKKNKNRITVRLCL